MKSSIINALFQCSKVGIRGVVFGHFHVDHVDAWIDRTHRAFLTSYLTSILASIRPLTGEGKGQLLPIVAALMGEVLRYFSKQSNLIGISSESAGLV